MLVSIKALYQGIWQVAVKKVKLCGSLDINCAGKNIDCVGNCVEFRNILSDWHCNHQLTNSINNKFKNIFLLNTEYYFWTGCQNVNNRLSENYNESHVIFCFYLIVYISYCIQIKYKKKIPCLRDVSPITVGMTFLVSSM